MSTENSSIKTDLIRRFFLYSLTANLLFVSYIITAMGFKNSLPFVTVMAVITPLAICLSGIIYFPLHSKIGPIIDDQARRGENPGDRHLAEMYPAYASFILGLTATAGFAVSALLFLFRGILYSWQQSVFFFSLGAVAAFTMGYLFYLFARVESYGLSQRMKFSPLKLFGKISIPILAVILISLSYVEVGLYRITFKQIFTLKTAMMRENINKNSNYLDQLFSMPIAQMNGMTAAEAFDGMNIERLRWYLEAVHAGAEKINVEGFFAANPEGQGVTSNGIMINVRDRSYFKNVIETGKHDISEPFINAVTGKEGVVCAVPVVRKGKVTGMLGATILTETYSTLLSKDLVMESGRYMIVTREGKSLFHPNKQLVGKVIGRDILDNGTTIRGITKIVTEKDNVLFDYIFNGRKTFCYKTSVPVLGHVLLFICDQDDLLSEVNFTLLEMIIALFVLLVLLILTIYNIAKKFSQPIRNTVGVIHRLADGDLNAKSDDFLPDEFGELIRNLRLFQRKLRDVIGQALFASEQLSSSAEELAATSQSLSEGAQTQAASVEEASASIEEVSGAVELINNNAGEQAALAKATFGSMDRLKSDNETVVEYAGQALNAARKTTEQANTGQRLMENTITGMNNIDESTKKIAETVRLISDISDQVNLLALNASIEAARAGEHGKGFAVVAEEISKLADETASSAKNISGLVKTGLQEVNKGREYVDATSSALINIIDYIRQTEELVRKITESAERQASSSNAVLKDTRKVMEMADSISSSTNEQMMTNLEMSKTMEQINQNTQAAAAASEQIASSAEEISSQAESLRQQMMFFKV